MIFLPDHQAIPESARVTPLALGYYMLSVHRLAPFLNQPRVAEILVEDEMLRAQMGHWLAPDFLKVEPALVDEWLRVREGVSREFLARTEALIKAHYQPSSPPLERRRLLRLAAGRKIDASINGVERWLEMPQLLGESIVDLPCEGLPENKLRLGWAEKATYGAVPTRDQAVIDALADEQLVARVEALLYPALKEEGDPFVMQLEADRRIEALRQWEAENKIPAVLNGVILPMDSLPPEVEIRPGVDNAIIRWQWLAQAGLAPCWTSVARDFLESCREQVRAVCTDRESLAAAAGRFYWPAVIG